MRRRIFSAVGVVLIALCTMNANECGTTPQAASASGVTKASVSIQTGSDGLTIEQRNVRDRLAIDNRPGSIKHLYVISAYSGQVIFYSTVRGKVTSSGKRLQPSSVVVGSSGDYKRDGFEAIGGTVTSEVLGDDGTYGSSVEYLYWWDAVGKYHHQYVTGGMILHISDQPIAVKGVVLNLSTVTE